MSFVRSHCHAAAAPSGEQEIGTLAVCDKVTAYDPSSGKTATQTVQHVFLNHDTDLLDVTLASTDTSGQHMAASNATRKAQQVMVVSHGLRAPPSEVNGSATTRETVHTTDIHPWLTSDRGWAPSHPTPARHRLDAKSGLN